MSSPPKKARGELASKTARKLTTSARYSVLASFATVFGAVFWFVEQRRWRLADSLDNEKSGR